MKSSIDFQLVQLATDGELRVSTEAIALGFQLQHKNVLSLLRRYLPEIESFGLVAFETRLNKQGSSTEFARFPAYAHPQARNPDHRR